METSIVINNFNYGRFLGECIESALGQSHPAKEVVVVDDGSTDESSAVISRYEGRVMAILKENGGQASAINAGYRQSRGDWVIFLDADDYLHPSALERIAASAKPGVAKIHWRLQVIDRSGRPTAVLPKWKRPLSVGNVAPDQGIKDIICPPTSGNAFARGMLSQIMPIPEKEFPINADGYLFARAPFFGSFAAVNEVLGYYRIHGANRFAARGAYNLPSIRTVIRQSMEINRLILADGARCGLQVPPDAIDRNFGLLKGRIASLLLEPGSHPIPGDSCGKILGAAGKTIVHPGSRSRSRRVAEFGLLAYEILKVGKYRRRVALGGARGRRGSIG